MGDEALCPLCMEELDLTERKFKPCPCGYQMCRFCWHQICEEGDSKCPNCRQPYTRGNINLTPLTAEQLTKMKEARKSKEKTRKAPGPGAQAANRRNLANVRVVQRNLVYVTNVPLSIAREDLLRRTEYFGQYGRIAKIVVNRANVHLNPAAPGGGTTSLYVTYAREEDALAVIHAVDGSTVEGRVLRASFGTTKYCAQFLRGATCSNPDCMYLHRLGHERDSFTKDDLSVGKYAHDVALQSRPASAATPTTRPTQGLPPPIRSLASSAGAAPYATSTSLSTPNSTPSSLSFSTPAAALSTTPPLPSSVSSLPLPPPKAKPAGAWSKQPPLQQPTPKHTAAAVSTPAPTPVAPSASTVTSASSVPSSSSTASTQRKVRPAPAPIKAPAAPQPSAASSSNSGSFTLPLPPPVIAKGEAPSAAASRAAVPAPSGAGASGGKRSTLSSSVVSESLWYNVLQEEEEERVNDGEEDIAEDDGELQDDQQVNEEDNAEEAAEAKEEVEAEEGVEEDAQEEAEEEEPSTNGHHVLDEDEEDDSAPSSAPSTITELLDVESPPSKLAAPAARAPLSPAEALVESFRALLPNVNVSVSGQAHSKWDQQHAQQQQRVYAPLLYPYGGQGLWAAPPPVYAAPPPPHFADPAIMNAARAPSRDSPIWYTQPPHYAPPPYAQAAPIPYHPPATYIAPPPGFAPRPPLQNSRAAPLLPPTAPLTAPSTEQRSASDATEPDEEDAAQRRRRGGARKGK